MLIRMKFKQYSKLVCKNACKKGSSRMVGLLITLEAAIATLVASLLRGESTPSVTTIIIGVINLVVFGFGFIWYTSWKMYQELGQSCAKFRGERQTCADLSTRITILETVCYQAKWLEQDVEEIERLFMQQGKELEYPLGKGLPDYNASGSDWTFH